MIAFVAGKLMDKMPHSVVVDTGGIGYEIFVPLSVFAELPPLGHTVAFHTCFVIREQMQALFGFSKKEDKQLFETLIQISGIGPKTALAILGHLPPPAFVQAIHSQDIKQITKVPGIGKKSAERLLLELRDKLPAFHKVEKIPLSLQKTDPSLLQDAEAALMHLGYNRQTASKAIQKTVEKKAAPFLWQNSSRQACKMFNGK